jgi:transcriptional regulator with GAF, ATPase, and Fis domain
MAEANILNAAHFNLADPADLSATDDENVCADSDLNGCGLIVRLEALEKKLIIQALQKHNHIKSRAAEELQIPRTQLIYRMKRLGL